MKSLLYRFCWVMALLFLSKLSLAIASDKLSLNTPVIDEVGILSAQEVATLDDKLRMWHRQKLMQGAVVIVRTTDDMPIFDYTLSLFDRWKLGDAKADNGLLMVIAQQERKYFIMTGRGLEGALPDVSIARIERSQLVPNFRNGHYYTGIASTLDAIATQLNTDEDTRARMITADKQAQASSDADKNAIPFLIPIILLGAFIRGIFGRLLGAVITGIGGAFVMIFLMGISVPVAIMIGTAAFVIVLFVGIGGGGGNGRPPIIISSGGFGGGGYSGGGGGYSGGGGGTAGGGAGGSW